MYLEPNDIISGGLSLDDMILSPSDESTVASSDFFGTHFAVGDYEN
jgi:hypothetical protein